MSYEKYLKYKSKYLNLKAQLHNEKIINQNGGANSEGSLQSLGSSPVSENNGTNPDDSLKSLGISPESENNSTNPDDDSLKSLGSSPASDATVAPVTPVAPAPIDPAPTTPAPIDPTTAEPEKDTSCKEKKNGFGDFFDLFGGKKLVRKERDEFSDSDYDTTESSLLSFESVESKDSDDVY